MFIHTVNHTLVYQPFPVAKMQQSKTQNKQQCKKKKGAGGGACVATSKKKQASQGQGMRWTHKTWVRLALYLSLLKK